MILGIDNGLDGAIVALDDDGKLLDYRDTPVIELGKSRRLLAVVQMTIVLREVVGVYDMKARSSASHGITAFVEAGQAIGTDGTIANWHSGASWGSWRGILATLGIPWEDVPAQTWQRAMLYRVLGDDIKAKSMNRAQGLFPELPLVRPGGRVLTLHGRSDAALIAEYGRRRLAGKE